MTRNRSERNRPPRARRPWWRPATPIAVLALGGLFALALLAPIPTAPNTAKAEVVERVETRLPGWHVARAQSSWEGAWTVVAHCGDRYLGFQLVPGHGLGPGDAWLQPDDAYSRSRLQSISDDARYLVWFGDEASPSLSCSSELARLQAERGSGRFFD